MKLRQTKAFCIFHHHNCGIRHIDANLDHRSGYQNLDLSIRKFFHDLIFFFWLHLSMKTADLKFRQDPFQLFGIVCDIFQLQFFIFLHHRADNIDLMTCFHFFFHETIRIGAIRFIHYTVLDRKSVRRHLIHYRNIQISVNNDGQCPRNRRGTHNQYMRHPPFLCQHFPLLHTKTVLLICHHQSQIPIDHFFLDQRMGSDNDLRFAALDFFSCQSLFLRRHGTCQQNGTKWDVMGLQQFLHRLIMLLCQHFCGHHQSSLISIATCHDQCQYCKDRLARAHISLHQTAHNFCSSHI